MTAQPKYINDVHRTLVEGHECGFSMLVVHAVGEPRFTKDPAGKWVRATDKKTGQPAVYAAKVPCGEWGPFQDKQANLGDLVAHLRHREYGQKRGLAVACGHKEIEMFEADDRETWDAFELAVNADPVAREIWKKIVDGYLEESPRGCPHVLWLCKNLTGSGKIAQKNVIVEGDDGKPELKCLLESRGPGQIAVLAPSPGSCHKSGRPYRLLKGSLKTVARITPEERRLILGIAKLFDEMPETPPEKPRAPRADRGDPSVPHALPGEKPGQHFNRVITVEGWRGMLEDGWRWQYVGEVSGRPHCWVHSKATSSISAHLTPANSLLIFSTNAPLEAWTKAAGKTHMPFHVYAKINHNGSHEAAGRKLRELGYGWRDAQPTFTNGRPRLPNVTQLNEKYGDHLKRAFGDGRTPESAPPQETEHDPEPDEGPAPDAYVPAEPPSSGDPPEGGFYTDEEIPPEERGDMEGDHWPETPTPDESDVPPPPPKGQGGGPWEPPPPPPQPGQEPQRGWKWEPIDSRTFAAGSYRPEWLVKNLVIAKQNLTVAGPQKTLKTSVAVDLAVSLGSKTPFLGHFDVYKKVRVAILSGESGRHALQSVFFRVCAAKGIRPADCDVLWQFDIPAFTDATDMALLADGVAASGAQMAMVDPAYLAVLKGGSPDDAKNVFAMGQHLARFSDAVLKAGCTPCIIHHANRQLKTGEVMQFSDLSYSGFAEHAAQWLLLSRQKEFEGDGRHSLFLNAGGREGQGTIWALSINEGLLREDFGGRTWDVEVEPYHEAKEHQHQDEDTRREEAKNRKKAEQFQKDVAILLTAWQAQPDRTATVKTMRGEMGGWDADRINVAIEYLVSKRKLFETEIERPAGRGGKGTKNQPGFSAIRPGDDAP